MNNFEGKVTSGEWKSTSLTDTITPRTEGGQLFSFNLADELVKKADSMITETQSQLDKAFFPWTKKRLRKELEKNIQFRQSIDTLDDRVAYLKRQLSKLKMTVTVPSFYVEEMRKKCSPNVEVKAYEFKNPKVKSFIDLMIYELRETQRKIQEYLARRKGE